MHVGTHPTRHLATLSNLLLPWTSVLRPRRALLPSPEPHCIAAVFGLYHGRSECDLWRSVSEDSGSSPEARPAFPADCLQPWHCQSPVGGLAWHTQMFQHMARFSDSLFFLELFLLRVRVTPGVYRPLAQLNPGFRYLHWPGFINCTHPFGLAVYCVFIKQSGPPRYCNLRSQFYIKNAGTTFR